MQRHEVVVRMLLGMRLHKLFWVLLITILGSLQSNKLSKNSLAFWKQQGSLGQSFSKMLPHEKGHG